MTISVHITSNGRMSLPARIRRKLGLTEGGSVFIEETPDGIILRTATRAIARARAIALQYTADMPEASADAFLAGRRADSGE